MLSPALIFLSSRLIIPHEWTYEGSTEGETPIAYHGGTYKMHTLTQEKGEYYLDILSPGGRERMKVVFVDDDFRRMLRADQHNIQKLINAGKFGRHKVPYKETTMEIEITKKGDTIYVKKFRAM